MVRKQSLRLYKQMIVIFGIIFNVNIKEGEHFLENIQVQQELKDADQDYKMAQDNYQKIKKMLQSLKKDL